MRYFFYINRPDRRTVVIADENKDRVELYPPERANDCSARKSDWLDYYNSLDEDGRKTTMFEICENQYKKFAETGRVPDNHDGYFVAERMKARGY